MILSEVLLLILIFLVLVQIGVLIGVGAFLVQFRSNSDKRMVEFLEAVGELLGTIPATEQIEAPEKPKTWDQKYEEELEARERRLRSNSGLQDLQDISINWGEPPAPKEIPGLIIKDK